MCIERGIGLSCSFWFRYLFRFCWCFEFRRGYVREGSFSFQKSFEGKFRGFFWQGDKVWSWSYDVSIGKFFARVLDSGQWGFIDGENLFGVGGTGYGRFFIGRRRYMSQVWIYGYEVGGRGCFRGDKGWVGSRVLFEVLGVWYLWSGVYQFYSLDKSG